ncbi:TPA: hypothetical protein ACG3OI_003201 [Legionella pneumophila]|nr:hypothetical protein [Legionella pneumophila]HEM6988850.1 hypothetical protein [Legionella pneumophila]
MVFQMEKIKKSELNYAHQEILNKGYSVSDFLIFYKDKPEKSIVITRKSQEITKIYFGERIEKWILFFVEDLQKHEYG